MNTDRGYPVSSAPQNTPSRQRFLSLPSTRLGWWSFGLMVAFVTGMLFNGVVLMSLAEQEGWRRDLLIFFGIGLLLCGLAAGIISLIALIMKHERSWLVWLPLLAGLFVVFMLLGELLVPH